MCRSCTSVGPLWLACVPFVHVWPGCSPWVLPVIVSVQSAETEVQCPSVCRAGCVARCCCRGRACVAAVLLLAVDSACAGPRDACFFVLHIWQQLGYDSSCCSHAAGARFGCGVAHVPPILAPMASDGQHSSHAPQVNPPFRQLFCHPSSSAPLLQPTPPSLFERLVALGSQHTLISSRGPRASRHCQRRRGARNEPFGCMKHSPMPLVRSTVIWELTQHRTTLLCK
jgi:hypothetical protein